MQGRMVAEHEIGALASVYDEIRRGLGLGTVPNVFKAMAGVSADVLLQNWAAFKRTLLQGDLPRGLKEMIGLVVSRENNSPYSQDLHARSLANLGVPAATVRGLLETGDSEALPTVARTVLDFAKEYCHRPDETITDALEAAGLSEDEVQEVVDTVLIVVGMNYFSTEAEVPADAWVNQEPSPER